MLKQRLYSTQYSLLDKLKSIDYFLIFLIMILGAISTFAMYSTDGGKILYHTKSHFIRFLVFFVMFIFLSFINLPIFFIHWFFYY